MKSCFPLSRLIRHLRTSLTWRFKFLAATRGRPATLSRVCFCLLGVPLILAASPDCSAVTFTQNTLISANDTTYDGQEIVVTNCTLTVDGSHGFLSLHLASGGILTHSAFSNAVVTTNLIFTTAEPHVLAGTNFATLNQSNVLTATVVVTDKMGTNTYTLGTDYQLVAASPYTGISRLPGSSIPDGSTILASYTSLGAPLYAGLYLAITHEVEIQSNGAIDVSGKGYGPGLGQGAGTTQLTNFPYSYYAGSGGGHGGFGGASSSGALGGSAYGSILTPTNSGSGGGSGSGVGGWGGGVVELSIGGVLVVDGKINADGAAGTNSESGGGAGGSILVSANSISGSGSISAKGGAGEPNDGGGGGGGQIALYWAGSGSNVFSGSLSAQGGAGANAGGAGTIYSSSQATNSIPQLLADNGGQTGTNTLLSASGQFDLTISGGAVIQPSTTLAINSLTIRSNSWFTWGSVQGQTVTISSNALIDAGGGINGNGRGYSAGTGPGAGHSVLASNIYSGGGGSYGGVGGSSAYGAPAGSFYGIIDTPADLGSGGGSGNPPAIALGGAGGGSAVFSVGGTLTLNGKISSDGFPGTGAGSGGGSGGTVFLTAGIFAGSGSISASGGNGELPFGGGGGGGRVAIRYSSLQFTGPVAAHGGLGATNGSAGTIFWLSRSNLMAQVVVDNGGQVGATNTTVSVSGNSCDLTITGKAAATASGLLLGNLFIGSNSWLSAATQAAFQLTVTNNATIQPGGGILLDGLGSPAASGSGAGRTLTVAPYGTVGSGAGYGGFGGLGVATNVGGGSYGSASAPTSTGSGGGNGAGNSPFNLGGKGGGALVMNVGNSLVLNGSISANGTTGVGQNSGGGSGGSIWLTVNFISGSGTLSANGGDGNLPFGGGGGGGRIALYNNKLNTFAGALAAHGGGGSNYGGAGTIYLQDNTASQFVAPPMLIVDNAGKSGTNTPLPSLTTCDLTIRNGAAVVANFSNPTISLRNLLITSNSWLISINSSQTVITLSNATIQAGGGIVADGNVFNTGSSAAGRSTVTSFGTVGSGGAHAGGGGASIGGPGGIGQGDSLSSPVTVGGSGGAGANQVAGGGAGGALRITASGSILLNGRISANGVTGPSIAGGGGGGGSLWLTAGVISGAGSIAANGGAGDLPYAGGGGGGRIALYYNTNQFAGSISAAGGAGFMFGGAGTIYLKPNIGNSAQVILDNGGNPGTTNTFVFSLPESTDLTVKGGAGVALAQVQSLHSLLVASNSVVLFSNSISSIVTIISNATIQAGGVAMVDGLGYQGGNGPGAGHTLISAFGTTGSGAGYGGFGGAGFSGAAGGISYGSITTPTDVGSGGGNTTGQSPFNLGGSGGGGLRLTVNGVLTVDGRLSADGLVGPGPASGGGAGGTLYITAGTLGGAGIISASGGAGNSPYGGGGAGGRIAVYFGTNQFTGSLLARGGGGSMAGGAGTVFLSPNKGNSLPQLTVDNGGQTGTNTPVTPPSGINLTISGGAVAIPMAALQLNSLLIASNSWLACSVFNFKGSATVAGNATIQAGGGITLDSGGDGPGVGPGAGGYVNSQTYGYVGGGAGNGGAGANGLANAPGGSAYGSISQPLFPGSGGGGANSLILGGAGGGMLQLTVQGKLQIDGIITANGGDFISEGGGGGSGGSLLLSAGILAGGGLISANGGDGDYGQGGGGGGGRIAILYNTNQFQGPVTAWGGLGAYYGGAGTIYYKGIQFPNARVIVDNDGWAGTNTPIINLSPFELTVSGSAVAYPSSGPLLLNNLLVDSGGVLTHLNTESNLDLTVLTNATITADGAIDVSDVGYSGSIGGPGAGQMTNSFSGSGAGYGGPGGAGISGIPGGGTYGSSMQPTDLGSRGGISPVLPGFSQGGGAVRLQVGGTLFLNGIVTANGNAAQIEGAGGGAGGSVWLTARRFAGNGMIFANGGPGDPDQGGGGGGGRIAIYSLNNTFTGVIGAYGASGAVPGGNGTIYIATNIPLPQIIVQSPSGSIESAASFVDLTFGSLMDFSSASPADFSLDTPNGLLNSNSLTAVATSMSSIRVGFPSQSELGYYEIQAGPQIYDIYGQPMSAAYIGSFEIVPPVISGRVVDTNGLGVPFLTINVSSNGFPILTDSNGYFSVDVFPDWAGTITPERGGRIFIPPSRSYADITSNTTNQNFMMATTAALALTSQRQGGNLNLSWYGLNGVSYQMLSSSNLVDWVPYNPPLVGTNGPAGMIIPVNNASPADFFQFRAGY